MKLDDKKTRRDQQRIRKRIAAGTEDFSLLVNYPDNQLQMAFDDYSDGELLDALADGQLVLERIRENRDLDRERVVRRTRERILNEAENTDEVATLDRLRFETPSEQRHRLKGELQEQLGPSLWGRRANRLLRFAAGVLLPVFLMWLLDQTIGTTLLGDYQMFWVGLVYAGVPAVSGALTIKLAQMMKYDIIPAIHTLADDPETALSMLYDRFVSNPGQTLRQSWDNL
jgi:hypothetical protein